MIVGLPKEIKDNEYRVGLTPAGVRALTDAGHRVVVERSAGEGSGFEDSLYEVAVATSCSSGGPRWGAARTIVQGKEARATRAPPTKEGRGPFPCLPPAPAPHPRAARVER